MPARLVELPPRGREPIDPRKVGHFTTLTMPAPYADARPLAADLCAAEPIHTPSSIQPHGVILVVEIVSGLVRHAAGEAQHRLGAAWQDQPLASLLGSAVAARILALADLKGGEPSASFVTGKPPVHGGYMGRFMPAGCAEPARHLDVSAHLCGGWIIVELEAADHEAVPASFLLNSLEAACSGFERAGSLATLCNAAAAAFGSLTGFERVMIYQFGEDAAGQVLAESILPQSDASAEQLPSFLHHHFPASDIPSQARALYLRNPIRVIPDVDYWAAALQPAWTDAAPLDMSDCSLRSVSPIHLQYLANMGVAASASVSIIRDGALWGLVACHHRTPRSLTYNERAACRLLAGSLERQIGLLEQARGFRERLRLRAFEEEIVTALTRDGAMEAGLSRQIAETGRMMYGDGAAVLYGDTLFTSGACPGADDLRALAAWLTGGDAAARASREPVFATNNLAASYPPAASFMSICSGLLSVTVSEDPLWLLLWFRAGQVQKVTWAGYPHKEPSDEPDLPLRPRASFAAWQETVHGLARPWSQLKQDAAAHLRIGLLNAQQVIRERDLNRHLARVLQDKDALLQQNDFLIGEVNHRVQNSLQLVASFLSLRSRSSTNTELNDALDEARRRLRAVALVHRRLYRGDQLRSVDAARYIEDLCADEVAFMGGDWTPHLSLKLASVSISTDKAVNLGLVLTELMINCNKHAYGGEAGPIEVELVDDRTNLNLVVADRGVGHSFTEGANRERGYGSRIIAGLIRQLGGTISHSDNCPGLRTCITMPAADTA